jgi:geranylgeranyl pyrophosphate synthase
MLDVPSLLKAHAARIEPLLAEVVPRRGADEPPDGRLSEGVWYQFDSGGKRIRPALCVMTCEVLGGDPRSATPFALATEILHNFLLIHDDIEDGDVVRRDRPTLWAKYGVPDALNIADYLIAKAYQLIFASPLEPAVVIDLALAFTHAFERTVEGQALDIHWRGKADLRLSDYYRVVTLKTAYYLAVTWVGGALAAGVPSTGLAAFWELGECIGPAFQIRDDIIDLTQGKGRGGEIGCDIREGKPSVLVARALEAELGNAAERERLLAIIRAPRDETSPDDIRWVIAFFERERVIDFAQEEARRFVARADDVLERLPLDRGGRERFREIARFVIDRKV